MTARWTTEGTNSGPWGGRPPTGRQARFSGVNIFRFRDGKVAELWNHRDDLGLMEQSEQRSTRAQHQTTTNDGGGGSARVPTHV